MNSTMLAVWIVCGITAAIIGSAKGRNPLGWLAIGFLFGLFGLIAACAVPNLNKR